MAKSENFSNSMNDVVETIGPVLQVFINDVVKQEMSDCNFVYDPQLSYETAIRKFRQDSVMNQDALSALPLFVFKRSVLRWLEDGLAPSRRLTASRGKKILSDGKALIYTPIFGEFDLDFLYLNKTMEDIEKFEITYLSDEGISGTREFKLNLPELGEFTYFADYNELQELEVNFENNFYKGLVGTIKIRGMFFTFRTESGIILNIDANFRQWFEEANNPILESINIQG